SSGTFTTVKGARLYCTSIEKLKYSLKSRNRLNRSISSSRPGIWAILIKAESHQPNIARLKKQPIKA
ncbi:MAG: hypothetical protein V5A79_06015, partial [Candidatus Bipolaricaulota bacterium]